MTKIFFYDENKELLGKEEAPEEAKPYSFDEIEWENGGMGGIKFNYYITNEDREWEEVTDGELLQFKKEIKLTILTRAREKALERKNLTAQDKTIIEALFDSIAYEIELAEDEEEIFMADQLDRISFIPPSPPRNDYEDDGQGGIL